MLMFFPFTLKIADKKSKIIGAKKNILTCIDFRARL